MGKVIGPVIAQIDREAFQVFDEDAKGYITTADLKEIVGALAPHLSDADVDEIIELVDQDGDGCVTFERFASLMMLRKRQSRQLWRKASVTGTGSSPALVRVVAKAAKAGSPTEGRRPRGEK